MKNACLTLFVGVVALAAVLATGAKSVRAMPEFSKGFEKKYIGDGTTAPQKSLAEAFKAAKKCNVCHDPNKKNDQGESSKKFRNAYGEALHKFLDKKDKKDEAKILESLDKVESMKAGADGPTFGELLKQGKLPVELK